MERSPVEHAPMRNPRTERKYNRQRGLQIFLPLGLVLLIILAGGVLLWPASPLAASAYADTALSFLILPLILFGVIALVVLVGGIYVLVQILRRLPEPAYQVQLAFDRVRRGVRRGADAAAEPFIRISAIGAAIRAIGWKRDRE
jgi:hypothetical protein